MQRTKIVFLVAAGLAWGAFHGAYAGSQTAVPAERPDPRAQTRHSKLKAVISATRNPDVILIGDSIAQQWRKVAAAKAFGTRLILNLGVGGDKTQNVLWRMNDMPLSAIDPKMVLILAGTNNLTAGDTPEDIASGVEEIATKARGLWARADIRVINILPRGKQFSFREADREEINHALSLSANDIGYRFIETDDYRLTCARMSPCINYAADNLHLSPAGYQFLSAEIEKTR